MRREGTHDTVSPFGDYYLTLGEARRAIHAYSHAEVIWEWCAHEAEHDFRAGVTLFPRHTRDRTSVVGSGDTPLAALEDLLWRLAIPALLAEDPESDSPAPAIGSATLN